MDKIKYSYIPPSRGWLVVENDRGETRFARSPFRGTHRACYQAIARCRDLVPADGLDSAILVAGAYDKENENHKQWQSVKANFIGNKVRMPRGVLLIPAGYIKGDKKLEGVLVEKDWQARGIDDTLVVPDLSNWKQNDAGIYVPKVKGYEAVFVPSTAYKGKSFEKDGVAHAHLTSEGAEIFAKTARDKGLEPYNGFADMMKEISFPGRKVSSFTEDGDRLYLNGSSWSGGRYGCAFAVSSREASAPRN